MTTWLRGALLGALALAACGRGTGGGSGPGTLTTGRPAPGIAPPSRPGDCARGVTIRIVGTNPGKVSSLVLHPARAGATCAPAAPACATVGGSEATAPLELASDPVPHDLAVFELPPRGLPPDGEPATLLVTFDAGTATLDGGPSGPLELCGPTVHVPFDPSRVSLERCSVTILLDVGRSVVATADGLAFVPQYRIHF